MPHPLRIAMWSGPRNCSTALMRSWENRPDTEVWDEPFYAFYLRKTGLAHPGRDEILARYEEHWPTVVGQLLQDRPPHVPADTNAPTPAPAIYFQKQMAHHLFPDQGRDWWPHLTHCFLIREPRAMLLSLEVKLTRFELWETGLPQQVELFRAVRDSQTEPPPVIDSRDLLGNPRGTLAQLCSVLDVPFHDGMLSWPPGPRDSDGSWGKHWYDRVHQSTGFAPYLDKTGDLPPHLAAMEEQCLPLYEELHSHRLTAAEE